jgi:hypothetical protein
MRIPTQLLAATASRTWLTTPVKRKPRALPLDDAGAPEEPRASQPPLESVRVTLPVPLGDLLYAALLAVAGDDATCAMLLASATAEAREQFSARLSYLEMTTLSRRNPQLAAVVEALNAAPDDAARTATLSRAPPALLMELAERLRPTTCEEAAQRYMMMINGF